MCNDRTTADDATLTNPYPFIYLCSSANPNVIFNIYLGNRISLIFDKNIRVSIFVVGGINTHICGNSNSLAYVNTAVTID